MRIGVERSIRVGGLAAGLSIAAAGLASPAGAQVLYSTGFEAPTFSTGPLAGQGGWGVFGTAAAVQVQNTFVHTGTQAVAVIPALAASQTGPFRALVTTAPIVLQSADIYLASSSTQSPWQFAGLGNGLIGFAGGINFSAGGSIFAISSGNPNIGSYARDTWNHLDLVMNFVTQRFTVRLNGTTLASGLPFCGANFSCPGAVVASYGSGIFDVLSAVPGRNDLGIIDNYRVAAVPEPTAVLLLASGLVGVAAAHRRRTRARS